MDNCGSGDRKITLLHFTSKLQCALPCKQFLKLLNSVRLSSLFILVSIKNVLTHHISLSLQQSNSVPQTSVTNSLKPQFYSASGSVTVISTAQNTGSNYFLYTILKFYAEKNG